MSDELPDELLQRIVDEGLQKILPKPKKDEKKKAFLSRCMGHPAMTRDFPDQAQRYAVCQAQSKKGPKSKK